MTPIDHTTAREIAERMLKNVDINKTKSGEVAALFLQGHDIIMGLLAENAELRAHLDRSLWQIVKEKFRP